MPGGSLEALAGLLRSNFPEGFHHRLAVARLLAGAVQRRRAGINQVEDTTFGPTGQQMAGDPLDRLWTPIGAHVGKNLGRAA